MLIDTNVLLDIIEERKQWQEWAKSTVSQALISGCKIILNPIVYAEASTPYISLEEFDEVLRIPGLVREEMPWPAAFVAAKAHLAYRQRGGSRTTTLPDFFIAAHALTNRHQLITRDSARFRAYFPALQLVTPESHPLDSET